MYRPAPTLAFGARDRFLPGFATAIEAAKDHGFTPALRSLGGRAAAYHPGSLVIDHIEPSDSFITNTTARFTGFGLDYVEVLRGIGIDACLGEIPGEYCPGEHSVNVAGRIKAIGTAQRVVSGAWLFSSSVVVEDPDPIRAVLTDVEAALGIEWDPSTGGSISEIHPEVTVDAVTEAFATDYASADPLRPVSPAAEELAALSGYVGKHVLCARSRKNDRHHPRIRRGRSAADPPPRPCAGRLREGTGRCRGHRGGLRRGDVSDRGQPEHVRTHGRSRWDSHRLRHLVPHLLDLDGQERYLARRPLRRSRVPRIRCRQGAVGSARTDLPRSGADASRMVRAEVEHTLDRVLRIIGREAAGRM